MTVYTKQNRERDYIKKYGITVEDYEKMHKEQDGLCALCNKPESVIHGLSGETQRLAIDHCHKTGRVRGLLCYQCNTAIGLIKDDVSLAEKFLRYLIND